MLLYSLLAGMRRKNVCPTLLVVKTRGLSFTSRVPLTSQSTMPVVPVVTLQLNVAVDPSVALTDVGVETNAAVLKVQNRKNKMVNYSLAWHNQIS